MNLWDILILVFVAVLIGTALLRMRRKKKSGCPGCCSCCDSCTAPKPGAKGSQ